MTTGYLFLLGALLGFSLLGILHKVADDPVCRPRMVTMLLLLWGAALTAAYASAFDPRGLRMPPTVLGVGAVAGTAAAVALFAFQASLRFGKISTSWLVVNLCVAVPVLVSVVVYGEQVTAGKAAGVALVFATIVLLWWDKRIDLARAGRDGETAAAFAPGVPAVAGRSKWLPLIMVAFLANGLSASSQKVLVELGAGDWAWQFYLVLYAVGAALVAACNAVAVGRPNRREMLVSAVMALASVAGNVCIVKALDRAVPGTIAYPVANGGSLVLVVLAGVLAFRERLNAPGFAGILLGIAATVILVLA